MHEPFSAPIVRQLAFNKASLAPLPRLAHRDSQHPSIYLSIYLSIYIYIYIYIYTHIKYYTTLHYTTPYYTCGCLQKCTSKCMRRQGTVLKPRNTWQKSLCPVVLCPCLCSSESCYGRPREGGRCGSRRPWRTAPGGPTVKRNGRCS